MKGLTLLLGGVRSGKSTLAVDLGQRWFGPVTFVATAQALDDDMDRPIQVHKQERPDSWALLEEPELNAEHLLAIPDSHFIIVDCLTLLVSNISLASANNDEAELAVARSIGELAESLATRPAVVVSNEVGMGVHPETELGRHYRDLLGTGNRLMAQSAAATYLVMAGKVLPLDDINQVAALYS